MDRGASWATVCGVSGSDRAEQLNKLNNNEGDCRSVCVSWVVPVAVPNGGAGDRAETEIYWMSIPADMLHADSHRNLSAFRVGNTIGIGRYLLIKWNLKILFKGPWASLVAQMIKNLPVMWETWV